MQEITKIKCSCVPFILLALMVTSYITMMPYITRKLTLI